MWRWNVTARNSSLTGDTNLNPALELFADGCNLLLADAGLARAGLDGEKAPPLRCPLRHIARDVRAGALLLTHINPLYDAQALLAEAREGVPLPLGSHLLGERYRI